jgi:hypothetical protein
MYILENWPFLAQSLLDRIEQRNTIDGKDNSDGPQ